MTTFEQISIGIQIIQFFCLAIAIIFYYRQAKAAKEQAVAATNQAKLLTLSLQRSTYIDFESSLFELSKLIIQKPEVRPYLYDNLPMPDKDARDYNLVLSFCVFYLDFFDHVLTMEEISPLGTQWTKENWENWICDMFKSSPSLRQVHINERSWFVDKLSELANVNLNETT